MQRLAARVVLVVAIATLVGCRDVSTRITYDGLEQMTFDTRTYLGWEQAVAIPDRMLREVGLGTEVHAYVADARVFAIDGTGARGRRHARRASPGSDRAEPARC